MTPLKPSFFLRSADVVAADLLGKGLYLKKGAREYLVEIVEVEAYLGGEDPASHAFPGPTPRNWPMFEDGGTCYVYLSYGMHHCLNVATGPKGRGEAVLFRAARPLKGEDAMIRNRGLGDLPRKKALPLVLSGPGKLTQALGIDLAYNGSRFDRPDFRLVDLGTGPVDAIRSPRIGISKAKEALLRFCVPSSPWLSRRMR